MEASPTAKETRSTRGSGRSGVTDDEEEEYEGDDPELVIPDPMPVLAHKVAKPETPSAFAALGKFAVGDTVSACFATIEMLDFLVNWLEHASRLEMETCSSSRWTSTRRDGATRTAWRGWTPRMP